MRSVGLLYNSMPSVRMFVYCSYLYTHSGNHFTLDTHSATYSVQNFMHIDKMNNYADVSSLNYFPFNGVISKCKHS